MKTLYIGIYDYPYLYTAQEIEDNTILPIVIPAEDAELLYSSKYYGGLSSAEFINNLSPKIKEYDKVIVCSDGEFSILDLTKK